MLHCQTIELKGNVIGLKRITLSVSMYFLIYSQISGASFYSKSKETSNFLNTEYSWGLY